MWEKYSSSKIYSCFLNSELLIKPFDNFMANLVNICKDSWWNKNPTSKLALTLRGGRYHSNWSSNRQGDFCQRRVQLLIWKRPSKIHNKQTKIKALHCRVVLGSRLCAFGLHGSEKGFEIFLMIRNGLFSVQMPLRFEHSAVESQNTGFSKY